eukprot:716525-Hanusia_phi.AAC.2
MRRCSPCPGAAEEGLPARDAAPPMLATRRRRQSADDTLIGRRSRNDERRQKRRGEWEGLKGEEGVEGRGCFGERERSIKKSAEGSIRSRAVDDNADDDDAGVGAEALEEA